MSSALGHLQPLEPETSVRVATTTAESSAGSIWSNERVILPQPDDKCPGSEIVTPGLRQVGFTPRHPGGIHKSHSIFRDPSNAKFAEVNAWNPKGESSHNKLVSDTVHDDFNEITTSYSDGINDYAPMKKSSVSIDKVDLRMKGDSEGMVLFGRWRHHKDAPLSFVKDMIEKDLRGPGSCSLYGPGGLNVSEHPLVCYYNERLRKLQQEENSDSDSLGEAQLSPILLQGRNASHRSLLRDVTPVTFNMSKDGTFRTTGFHKRTSSVGSTVDSVSLKQSQDVDASGTQKHIRRDSGVHGLQLDLSSLAKSDMSGPAAFGNYEVLRNYTPDPALNIKALNDETDKPYSRRRRAWASASYVKDFCGGVDARVTSQSDAGNTAHANTPQQPRQQLRKSQDANNNHHGYAMHRTQSRRFVQQKQLNQAAHREHGVQSVPPTQQQRSSASSQQPQPPTNKHEKHVNVGVTAPQDRQVTLVRPEEAENAMWSDDEEIDCSHEPSKLSKLSSAGISSPSPRGMLSKESLDTTSESTQQTARPILATTRASAAGSHSSSAASATIKDDADLDTSGEPTPYHTTPATTASSGDEREIKSPARAESLARRLAKHLRHDEEKDIDIPKSQNDVEDQQLIFDN